MSDDLSLKQLDAGVLDNLQRNAVGDFDAEQVTQIRPETLLRLLSEVRAARAHRCVMRAIPPHIETFRITDEDIAAIVEAQAAEGGGE